jgi:cbb3-type cytochrome c oxidase subunit III
MRRQTIAKTSALLIGVSGLAWGCASRHPLSVEEAGYPVSQVDAQGLFQENCVTCHGANGRAHTLHGRLAGAQNLTDPDWQSETSDTQIIHAIKTGPGVMPAFGKRLSESEMDALAAYVRHFKQATKP